MITPTFLIAQFLIATLAFSASWLIVTTVFRADRKSILAKVTAEQLKAMNSRTRAAEATVHELKQMLANFQVIIDSQAKALRSPMLKQGDGSARIWVASDEVFSAWKKLKSSVYEQGGVVFAGKLIEEPTTPEAQQKEDVEKVLRGHGCAEGNG